MKFWHILVVFIILAAIAGGVYLGVTYIVAQKQQSEMSQWTPFPSQATSTDASASSTAQALSYPLPTATTTVPTSWQTYTDPTSGYRIAYPTDVVMNQSGNATILAFPKANYFHWPLQDDAKITVTVASSCAAFDQTGAFTAATTTFTLNGYSFGRHESHDAAAGNLYNEWAYDTTVGGSCYRIDLFDHGANGAGLYVSDQALIQRYDDQHTADLDAVMDVWNTITASFKARQ